MNLKSINWDHVTRYSQLIAIVLFVGVFVLGFYLGKAYEYKAFTNALNGHTMPAATLPTKPQADVTYTCDADKYVRAVYRPSEVNLFLSDGRTLSVPQTVSGSGARYANKDETFVFWNKGTTAFITEGKEGAITFGNCAQKPIPE